MTLSPNLGIELLGGSGEGLMPQISNKPYVFFGEPCMFLILFVLHNAELLEELLDSWEEAGITGATILHSSGLGRLRQRNNWLDDLPLIPSLKNLFEHEEYYSRTLFTVVEGEEMVSKILAATEKIIGDLQQPDRGLMIVLPVAKVYGLRPPIN